MRWEVLRRNVPAQERAVAQVNAAFARAGLERSYSRERLRKALGKRVAKARRWWERASWGEDWPDWAVLQRLAAPRAVWEVLPAMELDGLPVESVEGLE